MRRAAAAALALVVAVAVPAGAEAGGHHAKRHKHKLHAKVHRKARGGGVAKRPAAEAFKPAGTGAVPAPVVPVTPAPGATAAPAPAPVVTPVPTPSAPALPAADPRSVSVGSTEFAFSLSQSTVRAGGVRIQFDNRRAEDPHELTVRAAGGATVAHFDALGPGAVTSRTVELAPGTYTLLCPLGVHEQLGMKAELHVTSVT